MLPAVAITLIDAYALLLAFVAGLCLWAAGIYGAVSGVAWLVSL
jgi:hypothetical protein